MADEPIAIVGAGCRFPGEATDLRSLGELLASGRTCFAPVPGDRWGAELHDPAGSRQGTVANHRGAFLPDVDRFDAAYFGIVPREAEFLDPQQRMLMEVAWEAMSDSGRPRDAWRGSRTAVYVGILANDYQLIHARTLGVAGIGPHYASGVEPSFAAGRIAYAFDLHGPVATVSSACSSSLLAVHLACQALRAGECDTALSGGVSLLLGPDYSVFMSSIGAVSRTGQCRPFDAAADGLVRGEGCGFVTLKRLRDALADSDRVHAVIRGSAVTHDGASIGLTAPNSLAQQEVLLTALERAGVAPADVDYIEAHGTGTPLGDQTELDTLAAVYGAHRQSPVPVGSVKAVFGHTDAAAGVAGLLKAIWVLRSGTVPPQPGFASPTPGVSWRGITVSAAGSELRADGRPLRAGVSSFGGSGTLVHAVVEAPEPARDLVPVTGPYVLLLSSAREDGLGEQAARMRGLVAEAGDLLGDLVASAATRATMESSRLAVVADGPAGLLAALDDPANLPDGAYSGAVADPGSVPPLAFIYAGQGGQWPGMALDLYDRDRAVRDALDECHALIDAEASWPLIDELRAAGDGRGMERTDRIQPAIFAVQVAITSWLAARGITPATVAGHSLGEVAAAHAAGCLSLAQAVRVVVRRAEVLHATHGTGRMYAVQDAPDAVAAALREIGTAVIVSGFNGPKSAVIAGSPRQADDAARALEERGLRCRRVPIDVATHSPVVAHCGPALRAALDGLAPAPASVRFLSSVDPDSDPAAPDAAYWARNLTDPVRLWPAVDRLLAGREHRLVEIGPHPVLVPALTDALRHRGHHSTAIATLRRDLPGPAALHRTLAQLHVAGTAVEWAKVTGRPARYRTLPAPSWGGARYWLPGVGRGSHELREPVPAALPATDGRQRDESGGSRAPATRGTARRAGLGTAGRVSAAVRDVLALPDDFRIVPGRGLFEQGLDSLTAASLRRKLEEEFAVELPASVIFEHPTITALAELLAQEPPPQIITSTSRNEAQARAPGPEPAAREEDDGEAIAVIGIGCRLPGAPSPDAFWTLLTEGRDALGDLPPGRRADPAWQDLAANVPTRHCYLDDIAGFDAAFFRVSPREARSLDPQQRMLLEVAWDALEDAGCLPGSLHGRQVGVYIGLEAADYQQLLTRDMSTVDLYWGTGTSFSAAAGRLSYFLGLNGPGVVVDTACSSALTAVHLACQALRGSECDIAVVGGAHAIAAPTMMVAMAETGALAPDGRCKTFDDDADGYGYGEGAVVLVLKPMAAARRDDDRVYAVIRASAVNQDGASGGFTVPSASAQAALITTALRGCGWSPADVDYAETHGTGTPLGDPIEVSALARAYGPGRHDARPLLIGSAKPNVGHLSAAAGVVGLLKVVLALYRREIPRHLVSRPSARIDWDRLPVALVTGNRRWPDRGCPSRAAVSSFGFTGSNAHVLVEQAPAASSRGQEPAEPFVVLPVTAGSAAALRAAAGLLARRLEEAPDDLAGIVSTATFRRSFLSHRLAVVATGPADLARALDQVARGGEPPAARAGHVEDGDQPAVTFWYGKELPPAAARAKFGASPAYQRGLAECAEHLARLTGEAPDLLAAPPGGLRRAYLFAHHVAITALWHAHGVRPDDAAGEPAAVAWAEGRVSVADTLAALAGGARDTARAPRRPAGVIEAASASPERLARTVAELYASGYVPRGQRPAPPVSLPGYPWEHRAFWYRGTASDEEPVVWPLSAATAAGLRARIGMVRDYASRYPDAGIRQVGAALAGRPALAYRCAVVGARRQDLLRALDDARPGEAASPARVVWVFPGQGSQWAGMGLQLLESAPAFARRMHECDEALRPFTGWSVIEALRAGRLERADEVQPALFAMMVSLAALWQSLAVRPAAVVGHSQGEIAAACVAGALSLEDAARVVALRSQALTEITGQGGMLSVEAGRGFVAARLGERLSVAAVNSPGSVVVAGDNDALEQLAAACAADGIRTRRVQVDYASHSASVERVRARILDALSDIRPAAALVPFYSALTADLADASELTAEYWYRSLREPVEFEQVIQRIHRHGYSAFTEISPHPILTLGIEETLAASGARVTGTLRRDQGSVAHFLGSAAQAWAEGVPVHWPAIFHGTPPDSRVWAGQDTDAFWDAVERDDIDSLAAELGADDAARASLAAVLPVLASWRRGSGGQPPAQSLCYRVTWRPAPVAPSAVSGTWLVVTPRGEAAAHPWVKGCVTALTSGGAEVQELAMPAGADEIARAGEISGVVSLLALDEATCAGYPMITHGLADTATLVRLLGEAGIEAPMWFLTCGAVGAGQPLASPAQAAVLGFTRVLGLDLPGRWGGQVDLPPAVDDLAQDRLRAALGGAGDEDQLAVRDTGLLVRRLARAEPAAATRRWSPRGTVLVTGGTGAVGRHVARWLAREGAGHLLLASRQGLEAPGARDLHAELTGMGSRVTIAACDVADRDALGELVAAHSPTSVFHAAGVVGRMDARPGDDMTEFADVLAAKVTGAANLHEVLGGEPLDAFVLFSSNAGVWGSGGQGAYAAANAYLDALAEARQAGGLPATSVAWGGWAGEGIAATAESEEFLRRRGMRTMPPELALQAMRYVLDRGEGCVSVADMDWDRFADSFAAARNRPLISELVTAGDAAAPGEGPSALAGALAGLPAAARERRLLALVREQAALVLGHDDTEPVKDDRKFQELGFDSLTSVELCKRLRRVTGLALPRSVVFDHPTPLALAARLAEDLTPAGRADGGAPDGDADGGAPDGEVNGRIDVMDVAELVRMARPEGWG